MRGKAAADYGGSENVTGEWILGYMEIQCLWHWMFVKKYPQSARNHSML